MPRTLLVFFVIDMGNGVKVFRERKKEGEGQGEEEREREGVVSSVGTCGENPLGRTRDWKVMEVSEATWQHLTKLGACL